MIVEKDVIKIFLIVSLVMKIVLIKILPRMMMTLFISMYEKYLNKSPVNYFQSLCMFLKLRRVNNLLLMILNTVLHYF